ncbi:MAG: glycosyltransferase, partial [Candidatus Binatia bacterium]
MRISIVLTGFDGGGAQRRLLTLASRFVALGHAVELLVGSEDGPFRACAPAAATVVPLSGAWHGIAGLSRRKSLRMLAAVPALVRHLGRTQADVLLCGSTPANLAALAARDLARRDIPVVLSVNVPLSRSTAVRGRPALAGLVRHYYPRADALIANAAFLAEDVVRFTRLSPGRVATIPNPVDVDGIDRQASEATSHPWLTARRVPLLLSVGKLKAQKDFPTLLRAFREVRKVRPARLLLLGSGEERERLLLLAAELGLGEDVELPGFVANPYPYMAGADVFVSSSRWEGFSNVIAEALACGCPVVATDCPGGVSEILGGGRFGKLVSEADPGSLARAVLDTLDSPPDRERLRE